MILANICRQADMITTFAIMLFYHGQIIILQNNLPTYDLCERVRTVMEHRMAETDEYFRGKLRCVQSETKGDENVIYHQASAAD